MTEADFHLPPLDGQTTDYEKIEKVVVDTTRASARTSAGDEGQSESESSEYESEYDESASGSYTCSDVEPPIVRGSKTSQFTDTSGVVRRLSHPPMIPPRLRDHSPSINTYVSRGVLTSSAFALQIFGTIVFRGFPLHEQGMHFYLTSMCLYNFLRAMWHKQSLVRIEPDYEVSGHFQVCWGSKEEEDDLDMCYVPRWCNRCEYWKAPRTHHCSKCDVCVHRMDHHCSLFSNCIGMDNQGNFLLMFLYAFLSGVHGTWTILADAVTTEEIIPSTACYAIFLALLLGICLVFGTFTGVLSLINVTVLDYLADENRREPLTVELDDDMELETSTYFFESGSLRSLKNLLGPSWLQRLFLPVQGEPVDIDTLAIHPNCSTNAIEILREYAVDGPPSPSTASLEKSKTM